MEQCFLAWKGIKAIFPTTSLVQAFHEEVAAPATSRRALCKKMTLGWRGEGDLERSNGAKFDFWNCSSICEIGNLGKLEITLQCRPTALVASV